MIIDSEVSLGVIESIMLDVDEQHRTRYLKPVVMSIVQNVASEVLILQSVHDRTWTYPYGEIRENEPILEALTRQLEDNTTIAPDNVRVVNYCGSDVLRAHGVKFYYFNVFIRQTYLFKPKASDYSDHRWVAKSEVRYAMPDKSDMKQRSMLKALSGLMSGRTS